MRKIGIIAVLSLLVTAFAAVPALAQNPHFLPNRGPTFTDLGTQAQVTGTIAGLGQEPLNVILEVDAVADVSCFNPGASTGPVPGQAQELTLEAETGAVTPDRQGRFVITEGALVTATPTVTGAEACPNAKWTATVTDVTFDFTTARILVEQPIGSDPVQIFP